jgi:hypothetical protein
VQLTGSHIAGSPDSLKQDNNSGTTGGQRHIARKGCRARDLDTMRELLGGVKREVSKTIQGEVEGTYGEDTHTSSTSVRNAGQIMVTFVFPVKC